MMETEYITQKELEENYPSAYKALPSSYKNDSCLEFFIQGKKIFANHDLGGTFQYSRGKWVEVD